MSTRMLTDDIRRETAVTQGGFNYQAVTTTDAKDTGVFLSMQEYFEGLALFKMDTHGGTDTIQCNVLQATNSGGAGAKALSGAGYAAVTIAAAAGSGYTASLPFTTLMLDVAGGFSYVGCRMASSGTATHRVSAHLLRMACHHAAASLPSA